MAEALAKHFIVVEKEPGLLGALRSVLRPRRRRIAAVAGVSFRIDPGEMVGCIGVNGAGKSTTIKMLTGVLEPSAGSVRVLGRDPLRARVANARDIGVVFGQRTQLWWDLPFIESLDLIARIYDVPGARYRELLARFSRTLELEELLRRPVREMSLGQKMRAELAAALIHEPRIIYLDEPTIGLDVLVKERIRGFIREQRQEHGTTVLLTTHDLEDIEELCQRVLILDRGKLIFDGPLATVQRRFGRQREMTFEAARIPAEVVLPAGTTLARRDEHTLVLRFDRVATSAPEVAAAIMRQLEVQDFAVREPDLTDVVKQIYGGALARAEAL